MSIQAPLLDISGFDRTPALFPDEREALTSLGWHLRRRRSYDPAPPQWRDIQRLLAPLDAARLAMRDQPDTPLHRRSSLDAAGLVLSRCAEEGTSFWGWSEEAWVRLIGEDRHAFERPWPGWLDQTVRPYVAAYGYLLCGFGAFHRLGAFNRIALVERVFGREAVGSALDAIYSKLEGWGYRRAGKDERLRTVVVQALLVDRSARLEDLNTEALQRLYNDPRMGWRRSTFHAVHRALAALGHAEAPAAPHKGRPMAVQGVPAGWMAWVERWYETSTLTPVVRRTHRGILAMAGRWLTAEQPVVTSPADWTRDTCAAWVASHAHGHRGLRTAQVRSHRPCRAAARPSYRCRLHRRDPDVLPRLPGVGLVRTALRPIVGACRPAECAGRDRPQAAGDRRRRLGQNPVGGTQSRRR